MTPDNREAAERYLRYALILGILLVSLFYLLRTVSEQDFFWHLKTGQLTWENRQLLSKDVFSHTTPPVLTMREKIILTSYWLSEVVYYLFFLAGGMQGIVFLRFLLIAGLVSFIALRRHGDPALFMGLLIIFLISLLGIFGIDRPHVFSFIFFGLLLYLLERIADPERPPSWSYVSMIPITMLVWANAHGGFVLGQVTLAIYLAAAGISSVFSLPSPGSTEGRRRLVIAGISGILIAFINPNSYHVLAELFSAPLYHTKGIVEYQSTLSYFRTFRHYSMPLYWVVMFVAVSGILLNIRKPDFAEIILLAGTGVVSFIQMRYMPFFMIAALPAASRYLSPTRLLAPARLFVLVTALFSVVFFAWPERENIRNLSSGQWIDSRLFPVAAADFIVAAGIEGNMFNYYDWGGYLSWRLHPERMVFIDSRALDEGVFGQYVSVTNADPSLMAGVPFWKSTLNAFRVSYVVVPYSLRDGRPLPVIRALMQDRDWLPVFFDAHSIVFVKETPENYRVITKHSIPKEYVMRDIRSFID